MVPGGSLLVRLVFMLISDYLYPWICDSEVLRLFLFPCQKKKKKNVFITEHPVTCNTVFSCLVIYKYLITINKDCGQSCQSLFF